MVIDIQLPRQMEKEFSLHYILPDSGKKPHFKLKISNDSICCRFGQGFATLWVDA